MYDCQSSAIALNKMIQSQRDLLTPRFGLSLSRCADQRTVVEFATPGATMTFLAEYCSLGTTPEPHPLRDPLLF